MASPFTKLPQQEIEVCKRLLEIRQLLDLEQRSLGSALGITRDRLASYENFRAPLRYSVGDLLCSTFNINQRWLATGRLPQTQYQPVDEQTSQQIPPRALFTEAYDTFLGAYIEQSLKSERLIAMRPIEELDFHISSWHEVQVRGSKRFKFDPSSILLPLLVDRIRKTFAALPPNARSEFYRHMGRQIFEYLADSNQKRKAEGKGG